MIVPTFHKCISTEDIPILMEVGQRSYKQNYLHIWDDIGDFYIQKSFSENVFKIDFEDKNVIYFIIYIDSIAVGLIKINLNKSLEGFLDEKP